VQLESGRFGSRDDTGEGEQQGWSFDDETPLESTPSEMSRVDAFAHSPVWWSVGAVVIMLLGAGAYVVADRAGLVDRLRGVVSGESPRQTADISMDAPRSGVHEAMREAARRAESRAAERFNAGQTKASEHVARGIDTAVDRAQKAHEETRAKARKEQEAQESEARGFEATMADADRALRNGAARQALELYRRAAQLRANSPQAQTGIGWALLNLGRTQPAAEAFRQALAARQNYGDALIGLGKAERDRGRPKQALDAYRRYLEAHPAGSKKSIAEYQADQLEQQLGL
jgi:tetratricopeptide (TPR) repeat protein